MAANATIFTIVDDIVQGICVHDVGDFEGLEDNLRDNYFTHDDVVSLIERGAAEYIGESVDDCEFYADDGELLDIYEADDVQEFLDEFAESVNFFFNPDTESWEVL